MPAKSSRQALSPARVRVARASQLGERAASLLSDIRVVMCDPVRTQIVRALAVQPLTVSDLVATTGRGRTSVSQHLRVLRQESLVESNRRGRMIYYVLTNGLAASSTVTLLGVVAELAL